MTDTTKQPIAPDVEPRLIALLTNEESPPWEVEGYDCFLRFKRPSLSDKHKGKAWAFRKMREFGYDPAEENSGTLSIQYWGQLNSFVSHIEVVDEGGMKRTYPFDPKVDTEYGSVYEKFVVEEIYNARGLQEEGFVGESLVAMARWLDETAVEDDEIKNS